MDARVTLEVLHCDDELLAVYKPPGLLSQADRTGDPDVLSLSKAWLRERLGVSGDVYLGLVHRLDRPASGIMVLARTPAAARDLSCQFRERTVSKRYLALVEGTVTGIGTCIDYLARDGRHVRVVPHDHPAGQRAELAWQSLAQRGGRSMLQVRLQTGRRHQIRVQLAHRGHPIVGDVRYGATHELDGQNVALHAYRLALEHPSGACGMRWTRRPPASWNAVLDDTLQSALGRLPV